MWKRNSGRGRKAPAGTPRNWPRALLWALLALETLWLGAFMLSNGSPLPPQAARWLARPGSRVDQAQNRAAGERPDEATELELRRLLAKRGSRGPAAVPLPPAPAQ